MASQKINWDSIPEKDRQRFCEELMQVTPFKLPIPTSHDAWWMKANSAIYQIKNQTKKWYWLVDVQNYWIKTKLLDRIDSYNPEIFLWAGSA